MDNMDNNNIPNMESAPQSSQPQSSQPQGTPPQSMQPQSMQPQSSQAQNSQPQGTQPQSSQAQNTQPQEEPKQRQTVVLNQQPKKKMAGWKKGLIILGIIIVCVVLLTVGCSSVVGKITSSFSGSGDSSEVVADFDYDYIGTLYVQGEIDEYGTGTYNHQYLLNAIDVMMDDPYNKGIILYIDTPGGSVFASDELYLKIKEYQEETGRPVYSSMQSQATSGGYYISAPCDKILANRNCWTGSIGVTMGTFMDVSELLENLGIKTETITSGKNKSMGSSYETLTEEQREIFQSLVDEPYEQFVELVAEGRDMSVAEVKKLADGRIYTAKQALENGLIDGIATYEEAVEDMKTTYKLEGCAVESFIPESGSDISSLLGILAEQKGLDSATDAELIEELIALNGTFRVSYMAEVRK